MSTEEQLKKFKDKVDPVIDEVLVSEIHHKFQDVVKYQIATGGKRLRPALAIISCKLVRGRLNNILYPAAGLEILHNYTLIVDDIIDHGLLRRNKPTLWVKYGTSTAECMAVAYVSSVFQTSAHSPNPVKVSDIFSETLKKIMADGEMNDILFERFGREDEYFIKKNRPKTITQNQYIGMISKKTASLFEACCEIGGVCAGATKREIQHLKDFGFNFGLAFQVRDDILDIFGDVEKFGKQIGKDIEERKGGNIVLLLASQELNKKQRQRINSIMKRRKITQKEIKEVVNLIDKTKARKRAMQLGLKYSQKAKASLEYLPKSKWNKNLSNLADFAIKRHG